MVIRWERRTIDDEEGTQVTYIDDTTKEHDSWEGMVVCGTPLRVLPERCTIKGLCFVIYTYIYRFTDWNINGPLFDGSVPKTCFSSETGMEIVTLVQERVRYSSIQEPLPN